MTVSMNALATRSTGSPPLFSLKSEESLPAALLLEAQSEIIDLMASGVGLKSTLTAITHMVEQTGAPRAMHDPAPATRRQASSQRRLSQPAGCL